MHVEVILTDYPFEYPHILCITNLDDQLSTTLLHIPFENVIAVLRYPHQMNRQASDTMIPWRFLSTPRL